MGELLAARRPIKNLPGGTGIREGSLDEIPLGEMNYIENSDVLDQENCELVAADSEEIPEDSSKETVESSKRWWRIIEGIKEHEVDWQNREGQKMQKRLPEVWTFSIQMML